MSAQSYSFTVRANSGRLAVLITDCEVCEAFDPDAAGGHAHPPMHTFKAIWDTGATSSVITQDIVDTVGLKATGMTKVHGVNGEHLAETYVVNFGIPSGPRFKRMKVTKGVLGAGVHALIGMDIITLGDFCVTNKNGITVFSFQVPSADEIDYVKQSRHTQAPKGINSVMPGFLQRRRHK